MCAAILRCSGQRTQRSALRYQQKVVHLFGWPVAIHETNSFYPFDVVVALNRPKQTYGQKLPTIWHNIIIIYYNLAFCVAIILHISAC